jgi:hypothetical protein
MHSSISHKAFKKRDGKLHFDLPHENSKERLQQNKKNLGTSRSWTKEG